MMNKNFATVISANLNEGIFAQLDNPSLVEEIAKNSLIIIKGEKRKYLGIISNIYLSSGQNTASRLAIFEKKHESNDVQTIVKETKKTLTTSGKLLANLHIIPLSQTIKNEAEEVDTIPSYLSKVSSPETKDIEIFYGKFDKKNNWGIGYSKFPLKEEIFNTEIPLNVEILTRGSFGIFGKAGTGKTMLGNIIASLIILGNKLKSFEKNVKLLIFDMHSEYGLMVKDQHGRDYAHGVGLLFKNNFIRYTPDLTLAKKLEYGLEELKINIQNITTEDIVGVKDLFDLSDAFIDHLEGYRRIINKEIRDIFNIEDRSAWIKYLVGYYDSCTERDKKYKIDKIEEKIGKELGPGALSAFRSGKSKLIPLRKFEFLSTEEDSINKIVNELFDGERSIIISFGRYGDDIRAYTFIANLISKKIWKNAIDKIMKGEELKNKLIIFLEEAHKFLSPELFYKNPFGNIARELRKRGILLCIIDQRPSQISEDVMAMLWNNFVLSLVEEKDIEVASRGLKYSRLFRPVISTLKRQEALIFGEAIKIPAVILIKEYKKITNELKRIFENQTKIEDLPGYD